MVSTNLYPLPRLIYLLVHTFVGIVPTDRLCILNYFFFFNYMSSKYSVCRNTNSEALPNCLSFACIVQGRLAGPRDLVHSTIARHRLLNVVNYFGYFY